MRLGIREIYAAALDAGFTPDQATTWTAIALAESGGETGARNPIGEDSRGLWQINIAPNVRENVWGDLNDPYVNARAAYDISHHGTDMRPWTTTHGESSAAYLDHLDDVSAVTGYTGDPRGVASYSSPLPPPLDPSGPPIDEAALPTASYDAIDSGRQPGSELDSDQDGLTDGFERLTGSSPDVADTDQDNLSDAYESAISHTDPLLADSDADAVSDAAEVALGTPAAAPVPQTTEMPAPTGQPGMTAMTAMAATTDTGTGSKADAFVDQALAQKGDSYVFGAEAGLDDADPEQFDCSELTQWAADQVGVTIPDGAMYQYLELKGQGNLMPVEEALHTKGALLFYFSSEPTASGGRPSTAHVAISLGDGRTIEARGTSYGVNEFSAEGGNRFNYAGVIPGMEDPAAQLGMSAASYDQIDPGAAPVEVGDADQDGLSDVFEQTYGFDPVSADTDGDGRGDGLELLQGSNPRAADLAALAAVGSLHGLKPRADHDADNLSNAFEVEHGLDPRLDDSDQDGLSDATELVLGTNPLAVDSDLDGLTDRGELDLGTDPLGDDTDAGAPDLDPLDVPDGDLT